MFDRAIINRVQQANDIVDVVGEHVNLTRKGKEMVGLCPFHEDHKPSMFVNPTKQIFKCFACGAGGGVFNFLQMRENLTFGQAIERLAHRAGIKVQPLRQSQNRSDKGQDIDPNALAKVNKWAAEHFARNLDSDKGKEIRDYLADRSINDQSIKQWQIGLALNDRGYLVGAAKAKRVPLKLLSQAGLATADSNSDRFVNRLMFTITDVTGRVIGFGGRTLDGSGAKYINSPATILFDKSSSLYGLNQARHQIVTSGTAVVVEGYTDCIMAHQCGCTNVVATLGTSFTSGHARILRRYARKIVLLFDNDIAGVEAANRALEVCLAQRIDIALASVPEGKDPCDFLIASGKERFEQVVASATDVFEFKWNRLIENFGSDAALMDNKAALEEYLQTVANAIRAGNLPVIEAGLIANRLARIVGLSNKQINDELNRRIRYARAHTTEGQKVWSVDLGSGPYAGAQREILEVLLNRPRLFETLQDAVVVEDFNVPALRRIAEVLFENLSTGADNPVQELINCADSVEMGTLVAEMMETGQKKGNFEDRLKGALESVERFKVGSRKSRITDITDHERYLKEFAESALKQNPRNLGMV
ncbi:MAG: DNA primase [Planctomycetota bacterium]